MAYSMFDDTIRNVLAQRGSPMRAAGMFQNAAGEWIDPRTGQASSDARDFAVRQMYVPGRQNELAYKARQPQPARQSSRGGGGKRRGGGGDTTQSVPDYDAPYGTKGRPMPTGPTDVPGDPSIPFGVPGYIPTTAILAALGIGGAYGAYRLAKRFRKGGASVDEAGELPGPTGNAMVRYTGAPDAVEGGVLRRIYPDQPDIANLPPEQQRLMNPDIAVAPVSEADVKQAVLPPPAQKVVPTEKQPKTPDVIAVPPEKPRTRVKAKVKPRFRVKVR